MRELPEALGVGGVAAVEVFHFPAAQVGVEADVISHRPAPELMAWDAMQVADDVPECDVDAADGGAADDAVAMPEMLAIHHLPEVLDAGGVFADEEGAQVLDSAQDAARVPFQRRLAPAV